MTTTKDTLVPGGSPDRVFYDDGMMLDAADFGDEQLYHRGRLARALAALSGVGTAAGLAVSFEPAAPLPADAPPGAIAHDETIVVGAGIAVDRLGRIIEIPRDACLTLGPWLRAQDPAALVAALDPALPGAGDPPDPSPPPARVIVADAFLRFAPCERGKTPVLQSGPFDALGAVRPARLRDGYELKLSLRLRGERALPAPDGPALDGLSPADRTKAIHQAIFGAWLPVLAPPRDHEVPLELDPNGDQYWIYLARLSIPATVNDQGGVVRAVGAVTVDNDSRRFVASAVLLLALGLAAPPGGGP